MASLRRFEDARAWSNAADLMVAMDEFCRLPAFVGRGSYRNQLERATLSISNNIAEGFERGTSNELLQFLYIAKGSAGEVRSMLLILQRMPDFDGLKSKVSRLIDHVEMISRQLFAWCKSVQESDIKGKKHLTTDSKRAYENARLQKAQEESSKQFLEELRREHEERMEQVFAERQAEKEMLQKGQI